jgi:hypothetical protein
MFFYGSITASQFPPRICFSCTDVEKYYSECCTPSTFVFHLLFCKRYTTKKITFTSSFEVLIISIVTLLIIHIKVFQITTCSTTTFCLSSLFANNVTKLLHFHHAFILTYFITLALYHKLPMNIIYYRILKLGNPKSQFVPFPFCHNLSLC